MTTDIMFQFAFIVGIAIGLIFGFIVGFEFGKVSKKNKVPSDL